MSKNIESSPEQYLTVATANTREAQMLHDPDGLRPFVETDTDILLMQEVVHQEPEFIEDRLQKDGYTTAAIDPVLGLAIAARQDHHKPLALTAGQLHTIHTARGAESFIKHKVPATAHRLRDRGLQTIQVTLPGHSPVEIANTHLFVFPRFMARARQANAIGDTLEANLSDNSPLILAGDMNHYPSPRRADFELQQQLGLQRVVLERSTWPMKDSHHEWMIKVGAYITRLQTESFDGELDAMLYRGVEEVRTSVLDISSDHRAIVSSFKVPEQHA